MHIGAERVWEIFVPSPQFWCEPETVQKEVLKGKKHHKIIDKAQVTEKYKMMENHKLKNYQSVHHLDYINKQHTQNTQ